MDKSSDIVIRRMYEAPAKDDGYRILVDRLWPRGMKKEDAVLDEWIKVLAPSTALRKWFDHRKERFEEFSGLYKAELSRQENELLRVKEIGKRKRVTLLYAAKDPKINHAVILRQTLNAL